jgi:hypothetical protein
VHEQRGKTGLFQLGLQSPIISDPLRVIRGTPRHTVRARSPSDFGDVLSRRSAANHEPASHFSQLGSKRANGGAKERGPAR